MVVRRCRPIPPWHGFWGIFFLLSLAMFGSCSLMICLERSCSINICFDDSLWRRTEVRSRKSQLHVSHLNTSRAGFSKHICSWPYTVCRKASGKKFLPQYRHVFPAIFGNWKYFPLHILIYKETHNFSLFSLAIKGFSIWFHRSISDFAPPTWQKWVTPHSPLSFVSFGNSDTTFIHGIKATKYQTRRPRSAAASALPRRNRMGFGSTSCDQIDGMELEFSSSRTESARLGQAAGERPQHPVETGTTWRLGWLSSWTQVFYRPCSIRQLDCLEKFARIAPYSPTKMNRMP